MRSDVKSGEPSRSVGGSLAEIEMRETKVKVLLLLIKRGPRAGGLACTLHAPSSEKYISTSTSTSTSM